MNPPRPATIARWIVAACAIGYGILTLARMLTGGQDPMPPIARLMLVITSLVFGGIVLSPDLVGWVTWPVQRMLDAIFLPSESAPPPVDYTLARHYVRQARYEEACEEYEKIIRYHPKQFAAYLEGIQSAARTGDEVRAARFHRTARRAIRTDEQRALLEGVYAARSEPLLPALDEENPAPQDPAS